jgi:DNA-binding CsgD family transcriptional regulator
MIECGELEGATAQLERLEEAAGRRGLNLRARIEGLRARLNAARGQPGEASACYERAVSLLGADDPLLDRALLHHAFGRFLVARGRRSPALEQLAAAHDLFAGVGAEPFRARVAADLSACGKRAAAPAPRSALALTEREQDVAALVSRGMTNREVAAELYVSEKAVEYHLRNVFGKLGLKSRGELRRRFVATA